MASERVGWSGEIEESRGSGYISPVPFSYDHVSPSSVCSYIPPCSGRRMGGSYASPSAAGLYCPSAASNAASSPSIDGSNRVEAGCTGRRVKPGVVASSELSSPPEVEKPKVLCEEGSRGTGCPGEQLMGARMVADDSGGAAAGWLMEEEEWGSRGCVRWLARVLGEVGSCCELPKK